jgi:predicted metal-dependent hydrolase
MARKQSSSPPVRKPGSGGHHLPPSVTPFVTASPPADSPAVEVRLSTRRQKSAVAFLEDGKIVIVAPARLPAVERQELIDRLIRRMLRRRAESVASGDAALEARARDLADRYLDGVRPASVKWVSNQNSRWASCTPSTGHIRVSQRLKIVPEWVLDAVLVHELAHLVVPSHSKRFRALEDRFPKRAEADAYLSGYQLGIGAIPEGHRRPRSGSLSDEY